MSLSIVAFLSLSCVPMKAVDVREATKLVRANYGVPVTTKPSLLLNTARCRQIARAAGYAQGRVSVLHVGHLFAVFLSDGMVVIDERLGRVQPRRQ